MYKCGCTFPWAGAADLCNIRLTGVPHCPWCVDRNPVLMAFPFILILVGQGLAVYQVGKRPNASVLKMLTVGLLTFFVLGALNGLLFKWLDGYPHFFF